MINTPTRVYQEIRDITRDILREPDLDVTPEHELRDELGLDSADLAELVVTLEARLGTPLPDDALAPTADGDPLATVDSLARAVLARAQG